MQFKRVISICIVLLSASCLLRGAARVSEVSVDGVVAPITTEILASAIDRAAQRGDAVLMIRLDTPGGLMDAMRASVARIVASPVPVVTFVAPHGARAASAGFFILEAGDVAAMAPGTNTGAAHPVVMGTQMDPVMKEKLENDAAASLRSVTSQRGRNVTLAETAVRQSKSFTDREALDGHLIDLIANDENDLLNQLDGRAIKRFDGKTIKLATRGAAIEQYQLSWRQSVMRALSDPNLALVILALGALGIYVEFSSPGLIFPGVLGAIFAVLGLAALSVLPLNWLGVALLLLAFGLFALEFKFATHGISSAGGVIALVLGAMMLIDSPLPEMRIHFLTALSVAAPLGIIAAMLVTLALRARRNKVVTGLEGMIGLTGVALEDLAPEGWVAVHGENWKARSTAPVARGAEVRVRACDGLLLRVTPETGGKD